MKNLKRTLAILLAGTLMTAAVPAFAADDALTRAEAAGILYAAAGSPAGYGDPLAWAGDQGIVLGYGNGAVGGGDAVTREQFVTMLYRYAVAQGVDVSVGEDTNILSYDDAFTVSGFAMAPYQWACGAGVLNDLALRPKATVTRTEAQTLTDALSGSGYQEGPLMIAKEGMFSSGGTVTEPIEGEYNPALSFMDPTLAGTTAHVDHANVFYQIPAKETGAPIVYLHGYGQSRMGWMTTPDGREGWSDIFLRYGHANFLVDQPRRGEAGNTATMTKDGLDAWGEDSKEYKAGEQAWYTHFRIGLVAPDRYEGSAFPEGEEAQNQFFRQMTPNTGSYDQALNAQALGQVLADAYEMTGKKSVYITHSQGGGVGWDTPVENVAAIVAIEPGGAPQVGSEQYNKLLEAKIPIIIYFGDYIDNGPEDIMSTGFWKGIRDGAVAFAEQYNADGGDATVIDLPKIGITGNSHFLFQELNNKEIADHVQAWLAQRGL